MIQIDRDFLSKISGLVWQDICFAAERKLIDVYGAIDFAVKTIASNQEHEEAELELASKTENDRKSDIEQLLNSICNQIKPEPEVLERWLFLALFWLYLNQGKFTDPLGVIEEIYADFHYPETIKHLVRYMPTEDGRVVDFLKEWRLFLENSPYMMKFGLQLI